MFFSLKRNISSALLTALLTLGLLLTVYLAQQAQEFLSCAMDHLHREAMESLSEVWTPRAVRAHSVCGSRFSILDLDKI